ncbi:hypothetical protein [Thiorhodococcus minor]|uniref:DUF59 domain-containing protein n=1 Tax=Thiorhodococcus minor TaxID=57489 RepID=A0A6M0K5A3_9GAMM|nr:hypothetical protein [Thiorhodococcus minor]NEV63535.1 hypothetical protein [Thiorhodococcus minor]
MMSQESQRVRELLREVPYPGFSRDIVAAGFVGQIATVGRMVEVELKADTRDETKVLAIEQGIQELLRRADFDDVRIRRVAPYDHGVPLRSAADLAREQHGAGSGASAEDDRLMTPLQAEMLEDGELPEADLLAITLGRLDVAPAAGYGPGGPEPLSGPREAIAYDIGIPVLQWDIDPHDPEAQTVQREIALEGWDYRVWWQVHSSGLLYVSMQAMKEDWVDHDNNAVPHPIGRSEAVNLVYDERREAVVAIYGTVRDFRPFVKAFSEAYDSVRGEQGRPTDQEAAHQ